jgi:BirA family biotin operon repressor/biotin-[acetyl-CoA-carboxylase] ligase
LSPADRLLPSTLKGHLKTRRFGRRVYYYPVTDSTNRVGLDLGKMGEPEGTVVVADAQTAGRGRWDHTWSSSPGNDLLFTLLLRPQGPARFVLPITLVFSLAVSTVLARLLRVELGVKWPNDIVAGDAKIGGILAEGSTLPGRTSYVAVGTGVNVNSDESDFDAELKGRAVSCRTLTGRRWERPALLADLLGAMELHYEQFSRQGFSALRGRYEQALTIRGRRVLLERGGVQVTATVDGVNDDGALRLIPAGGGDPLTVYNEEVRVVP